MSRDPSDALFKAMTRRSVTTSLAKIVEALGGSKRAAQEYGLSQRQVQRYVKADREGREVKSPKFHALKGAGKTSPKVRQTAMNTRRAARMRNHGARVKAKGVMGVSAAGRRYMRPRELDDIELSPEAMARIEDAWLAGDDEAALEALREALDAEYLPGFEFDSIDKLDFRRH